MLTVDVDSSTGSTSFGVDVSMTGLSTTGTTSSVSSFVSSKEQRGMSSFTGSTSTLASIPLGGVIASYGVVLPDGELSSVKISGYGVASPVEEKDSIFDAF